jgi:CRP-like cAMP-binding protein
MTYDRVGARPFPLTQAFLAQLQGVRRARINETGRRFRRAGLIHYTRGTLAIRDRPGLEAIACECYGIISREYTRLLG